MTADQWLVRVSVALGVIVGLVTSVRAVLRVARGTFRVFDVILGVGAPGDEDYRPSMAHRLDQQDEAVLDLVAEVQRLRNDVAALTG